MPTNLKYRARESQRKRESGRQPAKLNEKKDDRALEREQRRHFLLEKQHENQCSGGDKMRNAIGHQYKKKMSGSEKT